MEMRVLPTMKDADDFNPFACYPVKYTVALNGQASDIGKKFQSLQPHEWLLQESPEQLIKGCKVSIRLRLPPSTKPEPIDVFKVIPGSRRYVEVMFGHQA